MATTDQITLKLTCASCPEQYDALIDGSRVGYLRLRHGHFTVRCPDAGADIVYEASPLGDGNFDDGERDHYLTEAKSAIAAWLEKQHA